MWHEKVDIKVIEILTPPNHYEDPKLFENELKKVVGSKRSKELLKIEFVQSKPILEGYAEIISEISGLQKNVILSELTDEDELLKDKKDENYKNIDFGSTLELKNKQKHIGISLLIQTTEFVLIPTESKNYTYNKIKLSTSIK